MITDERFERIRQFLSSDWLMRDGESALDYARELFSELDARRRADARRDDVTRASIDAALDTFFRAKPDVQRVIVARLIAHTRDAHAHNT